MYQARLSNKAGKLSTNAILQEQKSLGTAAALASSSAVRVESKQELYILLRMHFFALLLCRGKNLPNDWAAGGDEGSQGGSRMLRLGSRQLYSGF